MIRLPYIVLVNLWNPYCCIDQIIVLYIADTEWKLLLIRQQESVGILPGSHEVFKVTKISILPLCLDEPKDLEIEVRIQQCQAWATS